MCKEVNISRGGPLPDNFCIFELLVKGTFTVGGGGGGHRDWGLWPFLKLKREKTACIRPISSLHWTKGRIPFEVLKTKNIF